MFKENHSLENRYVQFPKIRVKYPDRVPVIVEKKVSGSQIVDIDKWKNLVPSDSHSVPSVAQFMWIITKRIHLPSEKASSVSKLHFNKQTKTKKQSSLTIRELY
ncbi:gamma-aminobutyric acid receptor-associated protein-like 2 [Symphalangus syndactylus]|uniref:gamma-aminobutyric acid receptor-associated protein-like 2 n=1 Tax=Symphalangus syndactylus TaxID=9590 RepID=UPI0024422C09|nr:gamma-aminobutyric acid receptor-associated protein-like 2 [Symphalangus syndactylus]